jgi:hypothetical protein
MKQMEMKRSCSFKHKSTQKKRRGLSLRESLFVFNLPLENELFSDKLNLWFRHHVLLKNAKKLGNMVSVK